MYTVYFDTSFFINMGEADSAYANHVVDQFNRLSVRYVRSPVLFMELARRHEKADNHLRAMEYLAHFSLPPMVIGEDDWSALAPGPHREELGAMMRSIDETDVYVRAVACAANEPVGYMRFLSALLGDDAEEMGRLIKCNHPDMVSAISNGIFRRKKPATARAAW